MAEHKMELRGVEVTITDPDPEYTNGHPDDVVIYVDTADFHGNNIRIRINDALLYIGNPENRTETVNQNSMDGFFIEQL